MLSEAELEVLLGCDVVPLFRVLFAQMVASCADITHTLKEANRGNRVCDSSDDRPFVFRRGVIG